MNASHKKADIIWMNGEFMRWEEAQIHSISHGLHYGSAVFEGERAYEGQIFKSLEHSQRFHRSAEMLHMTLPYSPEALHEIKMEVLARNGLKDAYIRPIAWRGSEVLSVASHQCSVHIAIAAWQWASYFADVDVFKTGIKLAWADWTRP
ncbi:MAG: aminotransferase class IV, partial [Gammaproteobacteria bacterium]|nr:aminotransferase class IV [Gammaproteobacteria bacterium]